MEHYRPRTLCNLLASGDIPEGQGCILGRQLEENAGDRWSRGFRAPEFRVLWYLMEISLPRLSWMGIGPAVHSTSTESTPFHARMVTARKGSNSCIRYGQLSPDDV